MATDHSPNDVDQNELQPEAEEGSGFTLPFDPLRLVAALLRRWPYMVIVAALLMPAGIGIGLALFKTSYTAEIQLIRRATESGFRANQFGSAFKPGELKVETLVPLMYSVNLLSKIGAQANPPMTAKSLAGALEIVPERRTELIRVALSTKTSAEETARLVNLYAHEVVKLTKEMQKQEAEEASAFLQTEVVDMSRQLDLVSKEVLQFSQEETFIDGDKEIEAYLRDMGNLEMNLQEARIQHNSTTLKIQSLRDALRKHNPVATELKTAQEKLSSLLVQYTEKNPLVIEQQDHINKLTEKLAAYDSPDTDDSAFTGGQISDAIYLDLVKQRSDAESLLNRISKLETMRDNILEKLNKIPGQKLQYARLQARKATLEEMRDIVVARQTEAQVYQENALGYYRLFAETTPESALVSGRGKKVVIAGIGLGGLGFGLAFVLILLLELLDRRILTGNDLQRVSGSPNLGTLAELEQVPSEELEQWAMKHGNKILDALKVKQLEQQEIGFLAAEEQMGKSTFANALGNSIAKRGRKVILITDTALSETPFTLDLSTALSQPEKVLAAFQQSPADTSNLVTIQWPDDFKIDGATRTQFQAAKNQWKSLESSTLLVEIPCQYDTDGILFVETLDKLIWVSKAGLKITPRLAEIMSLIQHSECSLSGCLLNYRKPIFDKIPLFGRFIPPGLLPLAVGLFMSASLTLKATEASAPEHHSSTSKNPPAAAWQQRLTLGPGDVVDIGLYGYPNHFRKNVNVAPDGRISFLQARGIMAQGHTVDELRGLLDQALGEYFRSPRTMIMPREFRSKRYHIMGSVRRSGSYVLDRPVTVIEAVAQAEGIRTGLFDHVTIELADLERSFLVRGNRRMPVDFKALFHTGDLSQNILLEPDDYIYVPSSSSNEVYLLGAVKRPGAIGITTDATVMRMIAVRAGFLRTAYKDKVLIIRGSWVEPETFVLDAAAVLRGEATDFVLEPKDIIFVSERPWVRAEELLDLAARAFLQSATATWAGENIGPLITQPWIQ